MKGLIQEYGLILVGVAAMLICLLFGKQVFQHDIKDATVSNIAKLMQNNNAETGENITKPEIHVNTGDLLNIDGSKYIVISQTDDNKYLVMRKDSIGNRAFQSSPRVDGENFNTYQNSEIDNYLESSWYSTLSSAMKTAIQATNINQASYSNNSPDAKQQTGYNGQMYNTINRHVYLPSVDDIGKVVDLNNSGKIKSFLNGTSIWTRDSYQRSALPVMILDANDDYLSNNDVYMSYGIRPSFVIDLSKVDYTEVGHVNYK